MAVACPDPGAGSLERRIIGQLEAKGRPMTAREIAEALGEDPRVILYALLAMPNVVRLREPSETGEVLFRAMTKRDFIIRGLLGW
jgi:hypothetical protein